MQDIQATEVGSNETPARLKPLVRKHGICYEVWPCVLLVRDRLVKVGFTLDLCGANEEGDRHVTPGSPQGTATLEALRQIAEASLPRQADGMRCDVQPDSSLHFSPRRRFRPEVVLSIIILHRDNFELPADASEEGCLKQICTKLQELGVPGN